MARQGGRRDTAGDFAHRFRMVGNQRHPPDLTVLHATWLCLWRRLVQIRDRRPLTCCQATQLAMSEEFTAELAALMGRAPCGVCGPKDRQRACRHLVEAG
jgi:hypothetical protein